MKNKKNAKLVRLASVIEKDRLTVGDDFKRMVEYDIHKLLSEYADLKGEVQFSIVKDGSLFRLEVIAKAVRLKNFISPT